MIYNQTRQSGKTSKIVGMFKDTPNALLLVPTEQQRQQIIEYFEMGIDKRNRVVVFGRILNGRYHISDETTVFIDELSGCLRTTFGDFTATDTPDLAGDNLGYY